ncbi:MAG: adenylate/guanylate cyclase domain-containing protein [Comamonadaceae bacterium CG12_big_fil_rev_8_21_14_0_65_59_15]|nr:MAG: adenylate/guanylate cyclase domain-containing protein [Comamonadaceae bacterium CG12_big_fil_rev_8_21_14_0_65_59_15]
MKKTGFLRRHGMRISLSLAVLVLLLLNAIGVLRLGFVEQLENYTYDARLQWTMPGGIDPRVVIVDIDEKSLLEMGHWPWPRHQLAHLVDLLFDKYQIDVLGFDVLFAERDNSSGLRSLETMAQGALRHDSQFAGALAQLRPSLQYDQIFANSLKNRRVVLGYYFQHGLQANKPVGQLPTPALAAGSFDANSVGAVVASGYAANLPELQQAASAGGFFNTSPLIDSDGVVRRVSLLQMHDNALYETLSLAVARLALREPGVALLYEGQASNSVGLESLKLGPRTIPVDADMAALVPYRGRQGSYRYVSASDVLQGKVEASVLRGAIVLVGTTAPGLLDLRTAPMQESYAGVEVHANMITSIIDQSIRARPAYTLGLELILLLLAGLMLALTLPLLSPLYATLLSLTTVAALLGLNLYFWQFSQLIVPLAAGLVLIAALFVLNMSYGFFVDARSKRMLAHLFGQYVPPELVDEMAQDPGAYSLEGSSRELTVLFSDVRGFTTISEGLDPKQLTQLMNEFLTPMTQVIHHHRGTIDKYMGDAIMAFWGAPVADPDHARHALLAGLEMIAKLESLQDHFKQKGWPPIRVGVGLNTGDMTVGNMGSEFRLAYTIMGDAVNLGSRLESLTRVYGVSMMVSEFTMARVPDFSFRELDCVRVKGKERPVKIYEPLGPADQVSAADQAELADYKQALAAYRSQQWVQAQAAFAALQQRNPQRLLYHLYQERIAQLVQNPPEPDWDGSYTFKTK